MTQDTRLQQVFTGVAVALLLFASGLEGYVAAGLALALLLIRLVLFPGFRRIGIRPALVAFVVAGLIALIRWVA